MKYCNILIIAFLRIATPAVAQTDLSSLYAPDLILKHKTEIELTSAQEKKIREIYDENIEKFTAKRKELAPVMNRLNKLLDQPDVSTREVDNVLNQANAIELEIKKIKLITLVEIKNTLTPDQQKSLDQNRSIASNPTDLFDIKINKEESSVTIGLRGDGNIALVIIREKSGKTREMYTKDISKLSIDPHNIQSIEVIKGQKAIDLYGDKGKNGVIIIDTK
ncbi:MAG: Spy/CpxP family protein refolding chaperone [Cyclobacteriaceae bacterium]|nr:Spy/CpxP family protein refolding chaperone [Cyclobacteriaceae bacterium]